MLKKTNNQNINLQDSLSLRGLHLYLNKIYHQQLYGADEKAILNSNSYHQFKQSELVWMDNEKYECLQKYNCDLPITDKAVVTTALKSHPVCNHALFTYLAEQADLAELKEFILSESILNIEFFDYLALSIIGVSDQAKAEIICNLWDEAGHGNIDFFHTQMFKRLMQDLSLNYRRDHIISTMSWEALAGINLFSYAALNPCHKMKYFGLLAATEMLDPPHYQLLLKGISRMTVRKYLDVTYYKEHEAIDVIHADNWLTKVILPELAGHPEKLRDFWLGFYLRLDSAKRYYDQMLHRFNYAKAA